MRVRIIFIERKWKIAMPVCSLCSFPQDGTELVKLQNQLKSSFICQTCRDTIVKDAPRRRIVRSGHEPLNDD